MCHVFVSSWFICSFFHPLALRGDGQSEDIEVFCFGAPFVDEVGPGEFGEAKKQGRCSSPNS